MRTYRTRWDREKPEMVERRYYDRWNRNLAGVSTHKAMLEADKQDAIGRAREWLAGGNFVVFDTETTGLEDHCEIIQIGIVDQAGEVLLNTLIKPEYHIPRDATRIHGITDEMVADAPTFEQVHPLLRRALHGKRWAGYNLSFDAQKLEYQTKQRGLMPICPAWKWVQYPIGRHVYHQRGDVRLDVMSHYAAWWGEYSEYHGSYTWQKLSVAAQRHGLENGDAHDAANDAKMTLNLLKFIAGESR